jgi:hypothetical protein
MNDIKRESMMTVVNVIFRSFRFVSTKLEEGEIDQRDHFFELCASKQLDQGRNIDFNAAPSIWSPSITQTLCTTILVFSMLLL